MYDADLNHTKSVTRYKLTPNQIFRTVDTKFVVAVPIFKDGGSDKITAIAAFDTKKCITLPQNSDWEKSIRESCMILRKCIPFICKKN